MYIYIYIYFFFNPECEASEKTRKCNWRATRVIPMGTGFHRSHKLDVSHFDNPEIEKLLRDKNGVCMKNSYDFGIIELEKTVKQTIEIQNIGQTVVILKEMSLQDGGGGRSCIYQPIKLCDKLPIRIKASELLNLECTSQYYGKTKLLVVFHFEFVENSKTFQIGKNFSS